LAVWAVAIIGIIITAVAEAVDEAGEAPGITEAAEVAAAAETKVAAMAASKAVDAAAEAEEETKAAIGGRRERVSHAHGLMDFCIRSTVNYQKNSSSHAQFITKNLIYRKMVKNRSQIKTHHSLSIFFFIHT
jgi:predicted metal-dependent phosphotriesterase family hydrolase